VSDTDAVKLNDPASVGMPVSVPPGESVIPLGRAPAEMDHVNGVVPPLAASVCEYATPTAPLGNGDAVVIVSGAVTEIDRVLSAVCCGLLLSETRTVKLEKFTAVGVPVIVAPFRVSPAGREPVRMLQVKGAVPPVAARVCE